jgi:hypothetical protein
MMKPLSITETNLSVAWAKGFLALMERGESQRHPAIITIHDLHVDGAAIEVQAIRRRLDQELAARAINRCGTVAGTLFPNSMWNPDVPNAADALYARYEKAWPKIALCPANNRGVYFRRLTAYSPKGDTATPVNQLKFMVGNYASGNHRQSALQASILDPTRDHTGNRQKGFPCLQQVAFTKVGKGLLSVTGLYATQYQFEKAYGNYLGLYWLGKFMAHELKLNLTSVVCIASLLSLGEFGKAELTPLADDIKAVFAPQPAEAETLA